MFIQQVHMSITTTNVQVLEVVVIPSATISKSSLQFHRQTVRVCVLPSLYTQSSSVLKHLIHTVQLTFLSTKNAIISYWRT